MSPELNPSIRTLTSTMRAFSLISITTLIVFGSSLLSAAPIKDGTTQAQTPNLSSTSPGKLSNRDKKKSIFDHLDAGDVKALRKQKPQRLLKKIRKGRPRTAQTGIRKKETLIDGYGRETDLYLVVPKRVTGAIIVLHGLNGTGKQLRDLYKAFADKEGLIIAAPTAQEEPAKAKGEDHGGQMPIRLKHWWCYQDQSFVLNTLKLLKKRYSLRTDRVYLSGYSMGGFGTWNIGLRYPDLFAALVPYAGGISRREYSGSIDESLRKLMINCGTLPIYFIHGSNDRTVPVEFDSRSAAQLKKLGYHHKYVEVEGGGHMLDVREGTTLMSGVQTWLRKKRRNSRPRTIKFHSLGSYMNRAWWLRLEEQDSGPVDIEASIDKKNNITIKSTGVKKITLFLDDKLVKLKKKIVVTWNDKSVHSGKVKPNIAAIVDSWRDRQDPELTYSARLELTVPKIEKASNK